MQKIVLLLAVFSFTINCYSQDTANAIISNTDYLQKSKNQKTGAWVLTGAGAIGLVLPAGGDMGQAVGGGFVTLFSLGTVEPEYKSYTAQYLLSAAALVGGVTLFIASKRNKNKALAITTLKLENAPVLNANGVALQSYPVLALNIRL